MRRRSRRKRHREFVAGEIELMPMLNVFISIIPLLLLSAAFVPVTAIKTTLPSGDAAAVETPAEEPFELAITIRPQAYLVELGGSIVARIARESGDADPRAQLEEALRAITAAHPDRREVRIVSLPSTRYEEIVQVMDAARAAGLPEAALAEAVEAS